LSYYSISDRSPTGEADTPVSAHWLTHWLPTFREPPDHRPKHTIYVLAVTDNFADNSAFKFTRKDANNTVSFQVRPVELSVSDGWHRDEASLSRSQFVMHWTMKSSNNAPRAPKLINSQALSIPALIEVDKMHSCGRYLLPSVA
jgi:hypothetical protein